MAYLVCFKVDDFHEEEACLTEQCVHDSTKNIYCLKMRVTRSWMDIIVGTRQFTISKSLKFIIIIYKNIKIGKGFEKIVINTNSKLLNQKQLEMGFHQYLYFFGPAMIHSVNNIPAAIILPTDEICVWFSVVPVRKK